MIVLGIDPGATTGWAEYDTEARRVIRAGNASDYRSVLSGIGPGIDLVAVEMVVLYSIPGKDGKPQRGQVGAPVFETAVRIGQAIEAAWQQGIDAIRISRPQVNRYVTGDGGNKKGACIAALKHQIGEPGRKNDPGPTYGVSRHAWDALAVAYTAADLIAGVLQPPKHGLWLHRHGGQLTRTMEALAR